MATNIEIKDYKVNELPLKGKCHSRYYVPNGNGTDIDEYVTDKDGNYHKVNPSAGGGTVISVGLIAPTGFTVSGSPVTTSGDLTLSMAPGYFIPTTVMKTQWDIAYASRISSLTTLGTSGPATLIANVLNIPDYATGSGTGSVETVSIVTANGFAGTSDGDPIDPILTLSTTISGMLKGNGTAISAAVAGTDYQFPITLTTLGTSGVATFVGNTLNIPNYAPGTGTVETIDVATANGFAGTSDGDPTDPVLTLSTTVTGLLKGNGTAISAAVAGTDYQAPISLTTLGTSGAATFIANTLNIPQYTDTYVGTVTSVGLTMPSAFSVANSPITGAGTLAVTGAGTTAQYIRGDGTLATYGIATTVPISGLLAATAINSINNVDFAQTWSWNSLSEANGLKLYSNSVTASANSQLLLDVAVFGANANANQKTVAFSASNSHGGSGGTNIAASFSSQGGLNNYAIIVPTSSGSVGIGTDTPTSLLHVRGATQLGTAGAVLGQLLISGNISGTITVQPQASAGTYNFNLPTTAGTSGYLLTSAGGAGSPMTWLDPATIPGTFALTNGEATTANGTAVDLGGTMANDVAINAGNNNFQVVNIGLLELSDGAGSEITSSGGNTGIVAVNDLILEADVIKLSDTSLATAADGDVWTLVDDATGEGAWSPAAVTGLTSLPVNNTAHVNKGGNDGTALIDRFDKPFLTIQAAITAASSGDIVIVYPGTYTEQITLKNGVNLYLYDGVTITYAAVSGAATITDNTVAVTCSILGRGAITRTLGTSISNAIEILHNSSNITIEFKKIENVTDGDALHVQGYVSLKGDEILGKDKGIQLGNTTDVLPPTVILNGGYLFGDDDYGILVGYNSLFKAKNAFIESTSNSPVHNGGGDAITEIENCYLLSHGLHGFEMSGGTNPSIIRHSRIETDDTVSTNSCSIAKYGGNDLILDDVALYNSNANALALGIGDGGGSPSGNIQILTSSYSQKGIEAGVAATINFGRYNLLIQGTYVGHAPLDSSDTLINQSFLGTGSAGTGLRYLADDQTYKVTPVGTVTTVTASSPLFSSGGATPNITIQDAVADGSTKGAASFTASDFNASSGNISIDYTNGQAASGTLKGFLTAADWLTFNGKVGGSGTINELSYWATANTLGALAVATYPSLTEISYVKGVTSAIQTQLNNKANLALSNLAAVAINTSLISDADNTDDLGSAANGWKDVYLRTVKMDGSSSGTITLQAQAAAGTYNFNLPTTAGTSGYLLTSAGGVGSPMIWTNPATIVPTLTQYRLFVGDAGNLAAINAAITGNRALISDANGVPTHSTTTATQLAYLSSATGTTGTTSTNLVFSTSPTLVTPVIGAATGTSLAVSGDVTVADEAYGVGWNGSLEVPTKNAIYDKIQAITVPLSSITAAVAINSIDNAGHLQVWNWSGLNDSVGLSLESNSTGLLGTPTNTVLNVSSYGLNAGNTNVGATFSATNATNNYAIIVPTSSGFVGIGTDTPIELLHVDGTAQLGATGGTLGQLKLAGNTSGIITIKSQAVAGTYNFNLPTTAGTSGYLLTSGGGGGTAMTWTDPSTFGGGYTNLTQFVAQTPHRLFYSDASGDVQELAFGTSGQYLKANGTTSTPSWDTPAGGSGLIVGTTTITGGGDTQVGFNNSGVYSESAGLVFNKSSTGPGLTLVANGNTAGLFFLNAGGTGTSITSGWGDYDLTFNLSGTGGVPVLKLNQPNNGVGIQKSTITAKLHIAGSAAGAASTAAVKLDAGTLLGTTEAGVLENDGTHLYFTFANGGTRYQLDQQGGGSGITRTVVVTSGSATMGSSASVDYVYFVAGAHTMSLPAAAGNTNRYLVKNNHSANITLDTVGAENIEGAASISIPPTNSVDIISDGTNWWII